MPALEKVERIEIIRGPASVMWGTSAAHAIINIVTKDELQGQKAVHVSAGYGNGDGLWTLNLLKDIRMGDARGVISASYWRADGYDTPDGPNVKFPWGASTQPLALARRAESRLRALPEAQGRRPPADSGARRSDRACPIPGTRGRTTRPAACGPARNCACAGPIWTTRRRRPYSDRFKIQYTLYGDMLLQNRFPLQRDLRRCRAGHAVDRGPEPRGAGGRRRGHGHAISSAPRTRCASAPSTCTRSPGRTAASASTPATNLPTVPAAGEEQVPVIDIPSGNDNNVAVYAEDRRERSTTAGPTSSRACAPTTTTGASTGPSSAARRHHPLRFSGA